MKLKNIHVISRVFDVFKMFTGHVGVNLCSLNIAVAKNGLNVSNVNTVFKKVSGEAVS